MFANYIFKPQAETEKFLEKQCIINLWHHVLSKNFSPSHFLPPCLILFLFWWFATFPMNNFERPPVIVASGYVSGRGQSRSNGTVDIESKRARFFPVEKKVTVSSLKLPKSVLAASHSGSLSRRWAWKSASMPPSGWISPNVIAGRQRFGRKELVALWF